jgi:methionine-rich copper-binding protein CopC
MSFPRLLTAVAVAAGLTLVVAPALGHTGLTKSSPPTGAVVSNLPGVITLTFAEPIARARSITVTRGAANHLVTFGRNPNNGAQVRVRTKNNREGRYAVGWKVVGQDGHTITGTVRFRVSR